jgi:hypothetical protein
MRVGILTFQAALNYGAVLQVYSLKKYLESENHSVDIVNYVPQVFQNQWELKLLSSKLSLIEQTRSVKRFLIGYKCYVKFQEFRTNYLSLKSAFSETAFIENLNEYDVLLIGSDQVWNKDITNYDLHYFGKEIPKKIKLYSYAASLGTSINNIDKKEIELLKRFSKISVREAEAQVLLNRLLEREVSLTVDPVFLNQKEFWFKHIENLKPIVKGKYIFYYTIETNEELVKLGNELRNKTNYPVYSAHGKGIFQNKSSKLLNVGPLEFIKLIFDAEYVCTNSFHAVVFSIIFGKKTLIRLHSKTGSRIMNLLSYIGIYNNKDVIDFSVINQDRLLKMIKSSKMFLHKITE